MNTPVISIIIPIYNTEPYLRKCIDSVLAQSFTDWECVLVDDGSTDHSGSICDAYAAKDSRIRVIHQVNSGSVSARTAGIALARGNYLTFVDADDWVESKFLEVLLPTAQTTYADIISSDVYLDLEKETRYCAIPFEGKAAYVLHQLLTGEVPGWSWAKLYKTSFWKNNHIQAKIGVDIGEDMYQTTQLLLAAPEITHINEAFYHYNRQNPNGYCYSLSDKYITQSAENIQLIAEILQQYAVWDIYKVDFIRMVLKWKVQVLHANSSYAQHFMREYNTHVQEYPFPNCALRMLYAFIMCTGILGRAAWYIYRSLKNAKHYDSY